MNQKLFPKLMLASSITLALAACGGSDNDDHTPAPARRAAARPVDDGGRCVRLDGQQQAGLLQPRHPGHHPHQRRRHRPAERRKPARHRLPPGRRPAVRRRQQRPHLHPRHRHRRRHRQIDPGGRRHRHHRCPSPRWPAPNSASTSTRSPTACASSATPARACASTSTPAPPPPTAHQRRRGQHGVTASAYTNSFAGTGQHHPVRASTPPTAPCTRRTRPTTAPWPCRSRSA